MNQQPQRPPQDQDPSPGPNPDLPHVQRQPIILVADGSCDAVSEFGTWASVAVTASTRKVFYGMAYPTTISRCELIPILEGLRWIRTETSGLKGVRVRVISDSQYTVQTLAGMYEAKKNLDLWSAVRTASMGLKLDLRWRGRNSHPLMEICDSVAHALRTSIYGNKDIHKAIKCTAESYLNAIKDEEIQDI